ncbi:glycoside hydrolase [Rubripirellula lacrimiformis]|uniref:glycoside hydrolase n=1 Tax=Rubripirellula lacrimiformis TaxID=1930273 RepID=UPI00119E7729|nr:glycoside hydrolase [Rubripirellula lacrimiformis]
MAIAIVWGNVFVGTTPLVHADESVAVDSNADDSGVDDSGTGHSGVVPFSIERTVMASGYDGTRCWVHARAGAIPAVDAKSPPTVVVTSQPLMITGSDVFYALNSSLTNDLGQTWSPLTEQPGFQRWAIDDRSEETICDFTPAWHEASGKLLGTGQTVRYLDNKVMHVRPRFTAYSVYDPASDAWGKPKMLKMPAGSRFENCGAGSVQRYDLPNGDILLPVSFKEPKATQYSVAVCRCRFDGTDLTYVEHGSELTIDVKRGLYEPSITKHGDRFYLTMRNDDHGYVATSSDGVNFETPRRWTFDDGTDLGNYNTQQHWVTHANGLFLVYTRKGADNDHVFRHRAPLFIAEVDPEKLQVIRSTEQIVVPQRGARLGNFGVANITPDETWVVVTEWMQTWRHPDVVIPVDNPYGADNSIFVAKIHWNSGSEER